MISRRAVLGSGLVVSGVAAVAGATHRLDDVARLIGVKPRPKPDPRDSTVIRAAADDQNRVLALVEATAARHPALRSDLQIFAAIGREQVEAVGRPRSIPDLAPIAADERRAVAELVTTYSAASGARRRDALAAVSPALARVFASMSAGLGQCANEVSSL